MGRCHVLVHIVEINTQDHYSRWLSQDERSSGPGLAIIVLVFKGSRQWLQQIHVLHPTTFGIHISWLGESNTVVARRRGAQPALLAESGQISRSA